MEIDREKRELRYEVFPIMIFTSTLPPLLSVLEGHRIHNLPALKLEKVKICFSNGLCAKWLLACGLRCSLTFMG